MKVLVACEYSGRVRRAFAALGHEAWSCDLLPSEDGSRNHIQADVSRLLQAPWDLVVAHPPCTRLCNSGVRWLKERDLWAEMFKAAAFFRECLGANAPRVAVENPIMHKHAMAMINQRQTQIVQPWQFGHPETKATGLWLKNLPPLQPTNIVSGREARVHRMPPGPDRWKERSRTYEGIAAAMAAQWGGLADQEAA